MAAIVYEGMVAGNGDLFEGKKFFVMQRVPMRNRWVEAITNNGGEVVTLDKQADIIIADHATPAKNPVGAISWKYIEQSVARGTLEDIEEHRAGPKIQTVREVGSAQPPRSGRTPFTAQDDRNLWLWVIRAERVGASIKGNEIYKQLEALNPRHTFQSWRDRYVKALSHQRRPDISEEELSAASGNPTESKFSNHLPPARPRRSPTPYNESPEDVSASAIKPEPKLRSRPVVARKPVNKQKDKSVAAEPTKILPLVRKSSGGMIFTKAEATHMIDFYDVMAEVNGKRGVNAWAKYSMENPNHSAQEWHDYFVQRIQPLVKRRRQKAEVEAAAASENQQSLDIPKANISSPTHIEASPREDAHIRAHPRNIVDPTTEDEDLFIEDLSAMAEYEGFDVDFEPVICGRNVRLFQLWQLVNSDEFGGYDEVSSRDLWRYLARKFNFNESRYPDAAGAIKSAYEVILPDFEVSREEYMQSLQDEALIESQLRNTAGRGSTEEDPPNEELGRFVDEEEDGDDHDDDLDAPPSLSCRTRPSSRKRNLDLNPIVNRDVFPLPGNSAKRQRIDKGKGKGKEIPSTPEDLFIPSPTPRHLYKSSPLKTQQSAAEEDDDSDEGLPITAPNFAINRRTARVIEPETQDFGFPPVEDGELQISSKLPNRRKDNVISSAASDLHGDSSTQSQTDSEKAQEMEDYINLHISLGTPREIAIEAFESTTMSVGGETAIVMEELNKGNGIPEDMPGVWTSTDDAAMDDVDSAEFERVSEKHGTRNVVLRQKYLESKRDLAN